MPCKRSSPTLRIIRLRAELDFRGYLLTHRKEDLARYRIERHVTGDRFAALRAMTADNPSQRDNLALLDILAARHTAAINHILSLAERGDTDKVVRVLEDVATRTTASELRRTLDRIGGEEARLLAQREARSERLEDFARATLLAGLALVLLLAGIAFIERRQQLRALTKAYDDLAHDSAIRAEVEQQLSLLATNATDAVFRLGLDGIFHYASPSTRLVFGIDPALVPGQHLLFGVHPEDRAALGDVLERLASGDGDHAIIAYRTARPEGEDWRWVESSAGLVRDADGEPSEIIAAVRDISKRKALELELKAARKHAETAVRAKAAFLANMSHEIRTPMNGVLGFADVLLADDLAPAQRRHVELIADSGRAMMRLLNDILDLSKVDAGQMEIANEAFDLRHALKGCARLMLPAIEQKGLTLTVEIADDIPAAICGDGLRVRQVVLNLLGNAAKFTLEGSVSLRANMIGSADAPQVSIEIQDSGIGIEASRQGAIFEPFVQADAGTAGRFGGTGLGLSISARLARLMGGTLSLESTAGQGSRFTLTLPFVAAAHCGEPFETGLLRARPDAAFAAGSGRQRRILVAEDHDINQLLITTMLTQLGCDVTIAPDGAEAVAMVMAAKRSDAPFDLVLMDSQMPVLDGPGAARRIRAAGVTPADLPIVALTANAFADDVAISLSAGMQAHIAKPVTLAELGRTIERWTHDRADAAEAVAPPPPSAPSIREKYSARKRETLEAVSAMVRRGAFDEAELMTVCGFAPQAGRHRRHVRRRDPGRPRT